LTFGQLARQPAFNQGDWQKKYLGESTAAEKFQILQKARQIAWDNSSHQQNLNQEYYDRNCAPHNYKKDQWVLLKAFNFAHKNKKLAEKYEGPYQIVQLKAANNVELKIKNKRKMIVHVNRLKPYHDSSRFKVLEETDNQSNSDSSESEESDIPEIKPKEILKKKTLVKKSQKDKQTENFSKSEIKQKRNLEDLEKKPKEQKQKQKMIRKRKNQLWKI